MRISVDYIGKIFFGLFVISTFTFCVASRKVESSFLGHYFGKVKTVTTIEFAGTDTTFLTIERFNIKGKPVRIEYFYNGYKAPKKVEAFVLDNKGHLTKTVFIDELGDTTVTNHKSTKSGNVMELTMADKKLHPEIPSKAKTRISGTITSGKTKHKSIHYLDKNENIIERHEYDEGGSLVDKAVMENDRKGNQLSTIRFRQDTIVYSITQTFDRYSNVLTSQRIDGAVPGRKTIFRYDYDKHHNWIHRYLIRDKQDVLSEKQIIEYYRN